jgi:hypothetical protein
VSASRAITHRRSLRRRLVVGLVLFAYFTATTGFPLPATAARDDGAPFPCQGHRCGCQSAEQCWSQCCCFSPDEHLAWARTRGVAPPATAMRSNSAGWRTQRLRDQVEKTQDACCKRDASESRSPGSCCLPSLSPLGCKGLTLIWAAATAGFSPPAIVDWQPTWPLVGGVAVLDHLAARFDSGPSTPPPRSA